MSMPTFDPVVKPSPGTAITPQANLLKADFGDGYSQSTPKGLNHIRKTVSLKWDALTLEQMYSITDFFENLRGCDPFYYQPFGLRTPLKWTCADWKANTSDGIWSVSAEIVQSFTNKV